MKKSAAIELENASMCGSMARLNVNVSDCVRVVLRRMEAKGTSKSRALGPMIEEMIRRDPEFIAAAAKKPKIELVDRPAPGRPEKAVTEAS